MMRVKQFLFMLFGHTVTIIIMGIFLSNMPPMVNAQDEACQLSAVHSYTELLIIEENVENMEVLVNASIRWFVWSPDGTQGLYVTTSGQPSLNLIDLTTLETQTIAENVFPHNLPIWSPDGTQVAYLTNFVDEENVPKLYVLTLENGQTTQIGQAEGWYWRPSWSPDGEWIAYSVESKIYLVNPDGANNHYLVDGDDPVWSPDGHFLAYVVEKDDQEQIYQVDVQTGATNFLAEGRLPEWSPDGTQIAYISTQNDNHDIYVMDTDGENQTQLTNFETDEDAIAWSSDSTRIAFTTNYNQAEQKRDVWQHVWIVNRDGSNLTQITTGRGLFTQPEWSPLCHD